MNGKLINAKINVSKIDKAKLFKGQTGLWIDLSIWINSEPDQFGNDISIEQRTGKDENKIYLGNGKFYVKKDNETKPADDKQGEWQGKKEVKSMSDINELPGTEDNPDKLPF